ncbi:MAG: hypothetical protein ACYTBJ_27075 [Planctomycetota bacterium]|jgi:hypothetical protein
MNTEGYIKKRYCSLCGKSPKDSKEWNKWNFITDAHKECTDRFFNYDIQPVPIYDNDGKQVGHITPGEGHIYYNNEAD